MPEFALPYEQAAMHNEEMPAGLSIYDQAAIRPSGTYTARTA